ncbi:PAS domain-containing sensor histidine kinase [Pseudocnuella soli]|uniref:PAS domain-containing sensor histidine kinase n=1 Tax=Pseudocnuella soli TaxID=2502779 RepID=UPI0014055863|nr:PAS domain-containing protein [Pseudocnuella soli]
MKVSPPAGDFSIFEARPGIAMLLLPDAPVYTIVAISNDSLAMIGKERAEVTGTGLFDVFPPNPQLREDVVDNRLRSAYDWVLQHKQRYALQLIRYDQQVEDGIFTEKYWKVVVTPILAAGEVEYLMHTAEDITATVKAEQSEVARLDLERAFKKVEESEEKYRTLFNAMEQGYCTLEVIFDEAGKCVNYRYIETNPAFERQSGLVDVVGKTIDDIFPGIQSMWFAVYERVVKTGNPEHRTEESEHLDRWFDIYVHRLGSAENCRVGVFFTDVTERIRQEHRFRSVLDQAPDPIFILMGPQFVLEVANQALYNLWQVGPEALHKPLLEILPEMKEQVFPELLQQVLQTEKTFTGVEMPALFKRKNGQVEKRYLNFSYQPFREAGGKVTGVLVTATDITGQLEAKRKLQESERNLRNTILQAPVAMCILRGPDYMVEVANDRMFELWGKSSDVLLGKPLFEALPEVGNQGFEEMLGQVFYTGKPVAASEASVTLPRDGRIESVYVNFVYEPFREGDGSISGIIVVATDVTNQVKARLKIQESEQRVRSFVDSAPFPIGVYVGPDMRIELVNQSIIDVWGKGSDVVGKTYAEVLPELRASGIYEQLSSVYHTGVPYHARNQQVNLVVDGVLQPFFFNYSFTPLTDTRGKIYGVMNTAADVTDLMLARQKVEQSERNFRSMILQAPVAMCILLGADHIIDTANDLMIQLWGKEKAAVMQKPLFDALPDVREQGLEPLLHDVYHTGQTFTANERPVDLLRNGEMETVFQNFVYEPYRDAEGNVLGVLVISIDVTQQVLARQKIEELVAQRTTELAQANAALLKTNADLKRLNINLEEFAYAASHDMKEPVRKIHFFADMLKAELHDKLDEKQTRHFSRLEGAAKRMSTLIDDLLAYSQATKGIANEEEVNLNKKVQLVLEDLELEVQQKNAQITVGPLPTIRGNKRQLQQLFQNLISNALKYNKQGTVPEVEITAKKVQGKDARPGLPAASAAQWYHLIEVRDKGIGFDPADSERIFLVFTRLHGNAEYKGTGVGLSIVQKVAENHGGMVWGESVPGEGSVFKVLLPVNFGS